jgi:hypothetical protein
VFVPQTQEDTQKEIGGDDTPFAGDPVTYEEHAAVQQGDNMIAAMHLEMDFKTYIVAEAINGQSNAREVYTSLAEMFWSFAASGPPVSNDPRFMTTINVTMQPWEPTYGGTPDVTRGTIANVAALNSFWIS